jgi:hypothetical protein
MIMVVISFEKVLQYGSEHQKSLVFDWCKMTGTGYLYTGLFRFPIGFEMLLFLTVWYIKLMRVLTGRLLEVGKRSNIYY